MSVIEGKPTNKMPEGWHERASYREEHPLPFVITHWINLVCFALLIISGLIIHSPIANASMSIMRGVHIFCGIVIVINCIVRVILAFVKKSAPTVGTRKTETDIKSFLPNKRNRHQLGAWLKYYLFMKKDHPLGTKYGVPQKLSYAAVPVLIILMGLSGFCLWTPTSTWGICVALTDLVGGAMNMRIIHYFMMWIFIIFLLIHIYLVIAEGRKEAKLMLLYKESPGLVTDPDTGMITGFDDMDSDDEEVKKGEEAYIKENVS